MQIKEIIKNSINTKNNILNDDRFIATINEVVNKAVECLDGGNTIWWCGNGGSAADAQHLAAELSGRFYFDREPLASEALHVNTSYLTAVANDYSYDVIYSRYLRGLGKSGDMLIGISTSGNSKNIVNAFELANAKGISTVGMTGIAGGRMAEFSNYLLNVPSADTPRIQEAHILIGHIICELIENKIYK